MQIKQRNSKAQIGETLTWIVATIIIIAILIFFIFGASMLGSTKHVTDSFRKSLTSKSEFEGTDTFLKKSLYTYTYLEDKSQELLVEKKLINLSEEGKFNLDFNETRDEINLRLKKK